MIDNKTIRKVIMLNKLLPSGSPTYEDREASGAVANFTTNTVQPFVSCECQIDATESGTSVLNVTRAGANLLDPSTIEVSGTIQVRFFREDNILLKKGVTYKFVYLGTNQATLYFAKPVSGTYAVGTGKVLSFTPSEDCYAWLQALNLQGIETEYNKFVLTCDGSEPTTYEPYTGSTYTIALGQTVYGGTADVVGGTGEETHDNLDLSSLEWIYSSTYQRFSTTSQVAGIKTPPNNNTVANILCSHFDSDTSNNTAEVGKDNIIGVSMTGVIQIRDTSLNGDISALMTLLENVDFVYELATPTDFTFTGQPINSYLGVNNLWTDSGDVAVEYRSNF